VVPDEGVGRLLSRRVPGHSGTNIYVMYTVG
jgi:hypothetical protein